MVKICEFCGSSLKNNSVLTTHLKTNKKCLEIRGIKYKKQLHKCDFCEKDYSSSSSLNTHLKTCKVKKHQDEIDEIEGKITDIKQKYKDKIKKYKAKIKELESKISEYEDEGKLPFVNDPRTATSIKLSNIKP